MSFLLFLLNFIYSSNSDCIEIKVFIPKNVISENQIAFSYYGNHVVSVFKYFSLMNYGYNIVKQCFSRFSEPFLSKLKNYKQILAGNAEPFCVIFTCLEDFEINLVKTMLDFEQKENKLDIFNIAFIKILVRLNSLFLQVQKATDQLELFICFEKYLESREFYFYNFFWITLIMKLKEENISETLLQDLKLEYESFVFIKKMFDLMKTNTFKDQKLFSVFVKYLLISLSSIFNSFQNLITLYSSKPRTPKYLPAEQLNQEERTLLKQRLQLVILLPNKENIYFFKQMSSVRTGYPKEEKK